MEKQEKTQQKQLSHGFDAGLRTAQYPQDIGISVPHFNIAAESRAKLTHASLQDRANGVSAMYGGSPMRLLSGEQEGAGRHSRGDTYGSLTEQYHF